MFHAELAYLFRHALLRDAAYALQVPSSRAALHKSAFEILEDLVGRPPEPPTVDTIHAGEVAPHPADPFARELARHALLALEHDPTLRDPCRLFVRRAAEYAEKRYQFAEAGDHWLIHAGLTDGVAKGESMRLAATVRSRNGRAKEAEALLLSAEPHLAGPGARWHLGKLYTSLGNLYQETGRPDLAEGALQKAIAIHQEVGNRATETASRTTLAHIRMDSGRLDEAEPMLLAAIADHQLSGDKGAEGVVRHLHSSLRRLRGDQVGAEEGYKQAMALQQQVGDRRRVGLALSGLANVYMDTGRIPLAERTYEQALEILRDTGDVRMEALTLGNMGAMFHATKRLEKAELAYERSIEMHGETGAHRYRAAFMGNLADLYRETGRMNRAETVLLRAITVDREVNDRAREGHDLGVLAAVYHESGRLGEAQEVFNRALELLNQTQSRNALGVHLCNHAMLLVSTGKRELALKQWQAGSGILAEMKDARRLEQKTIAMRELCTRAGMRPLDDTD